MHGSATHAVFPGGGKFRARGTMRWQFSHALRSPFAGVATHLAQGMPHTAVFVAIIRLTSADSFRLPGILGIARHAVSITTCSNRLEGGCIMSEDGPLKASGVGSLSDSRGKENESARDQFDAAWRVGRQPSIERYLQTCQESHREALFRDLLEIEIEYRRRAGDTMNGADYHERFPDFIAVIDQILDDPGLPRPVAMETTADALPTTGEAVGITLGRYKLLQELGTGGFGVVYLAEQQKPVRRRVALKIIKLGMDTKQVVARFEAERQALALMDHPHIATVLDAGATHTGVPYFVMELVKGIPITKYCDEHNVSLNDRLKLFLQVCAAVQHAHQKGIIHRDLKPSNVLVELVDNRPSPKVIDFGIAKATDQRLTEQTMYTELGQFIGTPAYMSPEQTEVQVLDIDTRSDIYSLGVLLYELLTGTDSFRRTEDGRRRGWV